VEAGLKDAAIGTDEDAGWATDTIAHGEVRFWAGVTVGPGELVFVCIRAGDFHGVIEVEADDDEAFVFAPGGLRGFERLQLFLGFAALAAPKSEQDVFAFVVSEFDRGARERFGFKRRRELTLLELPGIKSFDGADVERFIGAA